MEVIVEARGPIVRKFFEAIIPAMLTQVKLNNSRKFLIVKTDKIDSQGVTIPMNEIDTFLVVINPAKIEAMGLTLAHEMVHVRQMAKGILKTTAKGTIWNGRTYSKRTQYLDMPWEQDAFAKQELVFRRAIND